MDNSKLFAFPADTPLLKELWAHATHNAPEHLRIYYTGTCLVSYSYRGDTIFCVKPDKILSGLLERKKFKTFAVEKDQGQIFFRETDEDARPILKKLSFRIGQSRKARTMKIEGAELKNSYIDMLLGFPYRYSLAPIKKRPEYFSSLCVTSNYYLFKGANCDYIVFTLPIWRLRQTR